jgi:hypothetical protein
VVKMTAPDTENSQFEEWMVDYKAKLREGVQKRFGLSHGTGDKNRPKCESMQGNDCCCRRIASGPHKLLDHSSERAPLF